MARTKKAAAVSEPETVDIIDLMTDYMTGKTGIPFARDAWENAAPEEYGVIELGDTIAEQWADGRLIDAMYEVSAYLYANTENDEWLGTLQDAAEEMEEAEMITSTYTIRREFLMDVSKVRWTMRMRVYGPIVRKAAADG